MLARLLGALLLATVLAFGAIGLANANCGNGKGHGKGNGCGGDPSVPELDPSLFGDGVAILSGFLLLNGARRKDQ